MNLWVYIQARNGQKIENAEVERKCLPLSSPNSNGKNITKPVTSVSELVTSITNVLIQAL